MPTMWLAALILGSGFAIVGANGVKWELLNVFIIVGCMGVGLGLGHAAELGSGSFGSVPNPSTFAMIFGVVGAIVCIAQNNSRAKPID
jgi:hypothetical protein